jgi:membrane-associated protease RseP (regulator of RpoE activity)
MMGLAGLVAIVVLAAPVVGTQPRGVGTAKRAPASRFIESAAIRWPAGTEVLHFENLEGIVLIHAGLRGRAGADTAGPLALDTGAGYLALDLGLAQLLGVADSAGATEAVDVAEHPLPRLILGGWTIDQTEPVLTVDAEVVRRVCDRPVLGLIGQQPLRDRAVWIDYREQVVALIPAGPIEDSKAPRASGSADRQGEQLMAADSDRAGVSSDSALARSRALLAGVLTPRAVPVRFALVGDGKILVHGALSDPSPPHYSQRLNLLVDTGATKCVLFEEALEDRVDHADAWPALRGLSAPTLIGAAEARIARIPVIELDAVDGPLRLAAVDAGVIRSDLGQVLSRVTHEAIHGLIGYSFLKRFRVVVDYPDSVLWLDAIPGYQDDRPFEYCHVGIQLERQGGAVIVTGVAAGSPAARAGIARGDEVVALDGTLARPLDLVTLTRRMEGEPGRTLTLVIRRGTVERTHRLVRRRLL